MNKRQGRKISRMLRNKSRKNSNVSSPVQIEDEELVKNQEVSLPLNISSHTMEEPAEKVVEESEKGKAKTNPNLEVSDPGGYRWPPTFSDWLKTDFWQFWQFTIFSRF
jgi:hypothetical protein